MVHVAATARRAGRQPQRPAHDRAKQRLLPEDDPVLRALGISDAQGRVKPSRQAKYRQVEEFLRALGAAVDDALAPAPCARRPPRSRCRSSTWAAATPTSPSRRTLPRARRGCRSGGRRRRQGAVAGAQHRGRRAARHRRPGHVRAGGDRRRRRSTERARTSCSPCTPATPPPTTRSPRRSLGGAAGARRAVLPPRRRRPAAEAAGRRRRTPRCARRHPARAVRRHAHRRPAGRHAAAAGLPRRRRRVRREPAHAAQHPAAGRPHRRRAAAGQARDELDELTVALGCASRRCRSCWRERRRAALPLVWSCWLGGSVAPLRRPPTADAGRRTRCSLPGPQRSTSRAGWSTSARVVTVNDSGDARCLPGGPDDRRDGRTHDLHTDGRRRRGAGAGGRDASGSATSATTPARD